MGRLISLCITIGGVFIAIASMIAGLIFGLTIYFNSRFILEITWLILIILIVVIIVFLCIIIFFIYLVYKLIKEYREDKIKESDIDKFY